MAELVVTQAVRADPAETFAAFTSADALARWWWPHIGDTTYAVDPRVGGTYDIRSQVAGIGVRGEFLELDPPRLIRMTWKWVDDGVSGLGENVSIAFAPGGDGTLVTVTHVLAAGSGDGDDLRQGWHDVLERLARSLDGERSDFPPDGR